MARLRDEAELYEFTFEPSSCRNAGLASGLGPVVSGKKKPIDPEREDRPMRNGDVAIVLAGILLVSATPGLAAPLPSRAVTGIQAEADLQALEAFLETKIVQETLAGLGLSPEEVRDRVVRLSPAERHQLASQLERLGAGGRPSTTLLLLIILALIILLIAIAI